MFRIMFKCDDSNPKPWYQCDAHLQHSPILKFNKISFFFLLIQF